MYLSLSFSPIEHATEDDKRSFLEELNIMKSIPWHENIISLIGCITISGNAETIINISYLVFSSKITQ